MSQVAEAVKQGRPQHDCPRCDGTGFVKIIKRVNGVQVTGRLAEDYITRDGKRDVRPVRCECRMRS